MSSDGEWSGESDFEETGALENQDTDPTQPLIKGWTIREHHLFVEALRKFATRWPEYIQYFPTKSTQEIKLYGLKLHDLIFKSPNKTEVFNRVVKESERYLKRRSKKTTALPINLPKDEKFLTGRFAPTARSSTSSAAAANRIEEDDGEEGSGDEMGEDMEDELDSEEEEEEPQGRSRRNPKSSKSRTSADGDYRPKGKAANPSPSATTPATATVPSQTPATQTPVRQSRRLSARGAEESPGQTVVPPATPTTTANPTATTTSSRKRTRQSTEPPSPATETRPSPTPETAKAAAKRTPKRQKTATTPLTAAAAPQENAQEVPELSSGAKKTESQAFSFENLQLWREEFKGGSAPSQNTPMLRDHFADLLQTAADQEILKYESEFHENYQRVYEFLSKLFTDTFNPESANSLSDDDWGIIESLVEDMRQAVQTKGCARQKTFLREAARKIASKEVGLLPLTPNPLGVPLNILHPLRFMRKREVKRKLSAVPPKRGPKDTAQGAEPDPPQVVSLTEREEISASDPPLNLPVAESA